MLLGVVMCMLAFASPAAQANGLFDGMLDGIEGITPLPYMAYPIDDKVNQLAQVRVTDPGFNYLEDHVVDIIKPFLGESFQVLEGGSLLICNYCGGSGHYCSISVDIQSVDIVSEEPNTLWVNVRLAPINFQLETTCACNINVTTNGQPVDVQVKVQPQIDGFTRQLYFDVSLGYLDLGAITDIQLEGVCDFLDFLNLLEGLINAIVGGMNSTINNLIYGIVKDAVDSFQCMACETTADCPTSPPAPYNTVCDTEKKVCRYDYDPEESCVYAPLGIEAEVDLGTLLKDLMPGLKSKIWASVVAGGYGTCPYGGLDLGMFGGTMPAGEPDLCTSEIDYEPQVPPRVFCRNQGGNVQEPCNENVNLTPHATFHAGIGLAEELLDQAGATIQDAGLLCLEIDNSMEGVGDYLSLSTFSLLIPSLKKYSHKQEVPVLIKLSPTKQTEPTADFRIASSSAAFPDPEDPDVDSALVIFLDDISINIYGFVDERYVRMFELLTDIEVTAGLLTEGGNSITPIFGLENVKLLDMRVPFSVQDLPPEELASTLEGLIGGLLGQIPLDPFEPILIPGFSVLENTLACGDNAACVAVNPDLLCSGGICVDADGNPYDPQELYIDLQSISPEIPKDSQGYAYRMLVAYANLRWESARGAMEPEEYVFESETYADIAEIFMPTVDQIVKERMRPVVTLDIGGEDAEGGAENLEYQVRIGNSAWKNVRGGTLVLDDSTFLLQGKHVIQVRSRDVRFKTWDSSPEIMSVLVDYTEPHANPIQEASLLYFKGSDNVTKASDLKYELKVEGGEWFAVGNEKFDLAELPSWPKSVSVKVIDEKGLETVVEKAIGSPEPASGMERKVSAGKSVPESMDGGCASSSAANWLLMLLLLPLAVIRSLRKARAFTALVAGLALAGLTLASCSGSGASGCVSNTDCGAGQRCVNGNCEDVGDNGDNDGIDIPNGDDDEIVGDEDIDIDGDKPDGDSSETDEDTVISCETHEDCPDCYYCSKLQKQCVLQRCDPNCPDIPDCPTQENDTCYYCDTTEDIHSCALPRCDADNWEEVCACRTCEGETPVLSCAEATGLCVCNTWCKGACPDGSICCKPPVSEDPNGECRTCPGWCEGTVCEPGYAPGGCDPTEMDCGFEWAPCDNINYETCEAEGTGSPADPNCACAEKPPLPIAYHGRFNDMAVAAVETDKAVSDSLIWVSTYNETYGDLMIGTTYYSKLPAAGIIATEESYNWFFADGVPGLDEEGVTIEGGPSGPRGGIKEPGANVGMFTSIALSADGWPRIAYQDVDNGDLLFMYTDGVLAEGVVLEEGAEIDPNNYVWNKIVVDAAGNTGYYADLILDAAGRPIIAYMTAEADGQKLSQLKLAMATSASPVGPEDFRFAVVESAAVAGMPCGGACSGDNECFATPGGDTCAAPTTDCGGSCENSQICYSGGCYNRREAPAFVNLPDGIGLNPEMALYSDGSLWIVYYDYNVYSGGETVKHGYLKRAILNGGAPNPDTIASAGFNRVTLAGPEGTAVVGNCGLYSSLAVVNTTGWWVVSFYNVSLNQLVLLFDLGEGIKTFVADDGWRDVDESTYQRRTFTGADSKVVFDHIGAFNVVYQQQTDSVLQYYNVKCYSDGECDSIDESRADVLTMVDDEYGKSYGYYPNIYFVANGAPIISSYGVELVPEENLGFFLIKP